MLTNFGIGTLVTPRLSARSSATEANMEEATGFSMPDRDGLYAARALSVSIILLFGLIFFLHVMTS